MKDCVTQKILAQFDWNFQG